MANTDRLAQALQSAIECLICSCKPAGNVDVDDAAEIKQTIEQLHAALASLATAAVEGGACCVGNNGQRFDMRRIQK